MIILLSNPKYLLPGSCLYYIYILSYDPLCIFFYFHLTFCSIVLLSTIWHWDHKSWKLKMSLYAVYKYSSLLKNNFSFCLWYGSPLLRINESDYSRWTNNNRGRFTPPPCHVELNKVSLYLYIYASCVP